MVGRAFSVKVDLDLHAVTCPGVWLCPNGKVGLQINIFDSCIATHKISPIFPLLYHDKFTFKKVFNGVTSLTELEKKLSEEYIFAELIQWSSTTNKKILLATFETNLVDLLYPVPCYKGLLAGVDVDLLMEPSKFFPGILSPKIEVSTRTTVEEVTDFEMNPTNAYIINPKAINSLNQRCSHKRREEEPAQKIIRQKRVCHSSINKSTNYKCRQCRRRNDKVEVIHNCCSPRECVLPTKDQCYLSTPLRKQTCNCSVTSTYKSCENSSICNDTHLIDSCPICSKYRCYFAKKKSDTNPSSKLYNESNYQDSYKRSLENKTRPLSGIDCSTHRKNMEKISKAVQCLDLETDNKSKNHKSCYEEIHLKNSPITRHKNDSIYRTNSAPSMKDDPTTSILLAKIKQLERTKQKLNHSNYMDKDFDCVSSCENLNNQQARMGFYKNLGKFYKRMYKQAKKRAHNLDEV